MLHASNDRELNRICILVYVYLFVILLDCTPQFLPSYIGVMYIGLMSIFLTIIGDSFTKVKEDTALQSNDYEIVDFMFKKIKALFG